MKNGYITLKSPGKHFRHPDHWPKWKCRFAQYLPATGLESEGDPTNLVHLLYCMKEESKDVLTSTNITAAGRKTYKMVLSKFDGYFDVQKNVIYEQVRFNQRNQKEGESAEQYITVLLYPG